MKCDDEKNIKIEWIRKKNVIVYPKHFSIRDSTLLHSSENYKVDVYESFIVIKLYL